MMKILVTGGAGFLGSSIVKFHLEQGDEVIVIDNLSTGVYENIARYIEDAKFTFIQQNIKVIENLKSVLYGMDRVYHFAAMVGVFNVNHHPIKTLHENINSFYHLLEAIRKLKHPPRVILASTSEVYGKNCYELSEDSDLVVPDLQYVTVSYAISKIANENMAFCYHQKYQIPITNIRIFNMVGPGQRGTYGMVLPRFVKQALSGEPLTVFGDGSQQRSFCDVRDFVAMLSCLVKNPESTGQVYNIGNDQEISIVQLAERVKIVLNSSSEIKFIPYEQAYGVNFMDTLRRKPNIEKLKQLIQPRFAYSLDQSILDIAKTLSV